MEGYSREGEKGLQATSLETNLTTPLRLKQGRPFPLTNYISSFNAANFQGDHGKRGSKKGMQCSHHTFIHSSTTLQARPSTVTIREQ